MDRKVRWFWVAALAVAMGAAGMSAQAVTVIAGGEVLEIEHTLADPTDLWVSPEDFTRINGFVLKPEGACLDEICIPLRQDQDNDLFVSRLGQSWVNASAFAIKVQQSFIVDRGEDVWSFGQVPVSRKSFLESAMAPDFALEGRDGNTVRLSDFRGKKVLIITWASW